MAVFIHFGQKHLKIHDKKAYKYSLEEKKNYTNSRCEIKAEMGPSDTVRNKHGLYWNVWQAFCNVDSAD